MKSTARLTLVVACILIVPTVSCAAEIARLTPQTWDAFAPAGKEVDGIYGDYVLRNDQLVVVIAEPLRTRNANMTVRSVGGMIIDLTRRGQQNDQLSAYHPHGTPLVVGDPGSVAIQIDGQMKSAPELVSQAGKQINLQVAARTKHGLDVTIRYRLVDEQPYLVAETEMNNPQGKEVTLIISDLIRADGPFAFGNDVATGMFWAHDEWYRQAYGVIVDGRAVNQSM